MGGLGSGHPYWKGKKETVEACRELDVRDWQRKGYLHDTPSDMTITWSRDGQQIAAIGVIATRRSVRLDYVTWQRPDQSDKKSHTYTVPVDWTACNFGGKRPWFICPGVVNGRSCNRRVAKLYLSSGYFLCRHCHDLTYETRQTGKQDYALRKCQKIRQRLGGNANMTLPFPPRPKHMHHTTYLKLRWEYVEAQEQYTASLIAFLDRMDSSISRRLSGE